MCKISSGAVFALMLQMCLVAPSIAGCDIERTPLGNFSDYIKEAKRAENINLRFVALQSAVDIANCMDEAAIRSVADADINALVEFLLSENIAIRYNAASALGALGPRAILAVPALERARAEASPPRGTEVIGPSQGGEGIYSIAIERITKTSRERGTQR